MFLHCRCVCVYMNFLLPVKQIYHSTRAPTSINGNPPNTCTTTKHPTPYMNAHTLIAVQFFGFIFLAVSQKSKMEISRFLCLLLILTNLSRSKRLINHDENQHTISSFLRQTHRIKPVDLSLQGRSLTFFEKNRVDVSTSGNPKVFSSLSIAITRTTLYDMKIIKTFSHRRYIRLLR